MNEDLQEAPQVGAGKKVITFDLARINASLN